MAGQSRLWLRFAAALTFVKRPDRAGAGPACGEFVKGMNVPKKGLGPDLEDSEEDEEASLPQADEGDSAGEDVGGEGRSLALGRAAVLHYAKLAPAQPGVYRMIDARGDVLYVGKAKNVRNRVRAYARPAGLDTRIERMIGATRALEFVVTRTETEALLLEANLIKRLRPRFNVLLRDDKSFPYILITSDHWAPQILKHRGARSRPGQYYGPFASVWAVNRTINALQRAFLLRSCSDPFFESRTRPCLLHQIKRCSAPCTNEIGFAEYGALVREANAFLSGRSKAVKDELAAEMEKAATALDYERAAVYRDRLAALSAIQAHQGVNPRGVEEADVFALHQQGGFACVEVFFFRTGQNWGNRAYFPKADRSVTPDEILAAFLAQFYDDKPCPRLILISHDIDDRALLAEALGTKSGHKVEVAIPRRGERKDLIEHALANAREALGRKLAETSSQQRLLRQLTETFGLPRVPRRIEVYDNSHIQGANAVGAMIVAGAEGFRKNDYRKFNIRSADLSPGDDFAMMREVLTRRFKRLIAEAPREDISSPEQCAADGRKRSEEASSTDVTGARQTSLGDVRTSKEGDDSAALPPEETDILRAESEEPDDSPWPDLVLVDGGQGQLTAAREVLAALGIDMALVAIAKGPDRDAGRETFFIPGRDPFKLPPRDPVLYFVERLRDEAHRFAVGSHRTRRARQMREGGLQEITGIGPTRKRALLHHFGTLKAIERASVTDLLQVDGISAETARRIYEFFHEGMA
jgi:excinuclease ABC subunit C